MMKISAVYKIVNTITNDFYVGSSKDVKRRKYQNKYYNQLCSYNGEALTLNALSARFRRAGIEYPTTEAKKYLL